MYDSRQLELPPSKRKMASQEDIECEISYQCVHGKHEQEPYMLHLLKFEDSPTLVCKSLFHEPDPCEASL